MSVYTNHISIAFDGFLFSPYGRHFWAYEEHQINLDESAEIRYLFFFKRIAFIRSVMKSVLIVCIIWGRAWSTNLVFEGSVWCHFMVLLYCQQLLSPLCRSCLLLSKWVTSCCTRWQYHLHWYWALELIFNQSNITNIPS